MIYLSDKRVIDSMGRRALLTKMDYERRLSRVSSGKPLISPKLQTRGGEKRRRKTHDRDNNTRSART